MRLIGAGLLVLVSLLAGALGAGALLWSNVPQRSTWPIVILGRDGNLLLADLEGRTQPLTTDADGQGNVYLYPTPAPDGRRVASVAVTHSGTLANASLVVHDLAGNRNVLYSEAGSTPFYLSWSPDSQRLAFLASSAGGMTLHGVDLGASSAARRITPGQPSYFAWSPDSRHLLLHTGGGPPNGVIQLYEWGAEQPQQLALEPTWFQAPVWLGDGQRAIASVRQAGGTSLVEIDRSGAVVQQIASVHPSTIFVLSPNAQQIAYIAIAGPSAGRLHVIDADGSDDRTIGNEPVVTGFWSPTSQMLAFISISTGDNTQPVEWNRQQQAPQLRWNVLDLQDGSVRSLDLFRPSQEFLSLLPFFDQYAQSIRLWDRTGTRLLYATDEGVQMLDVRSGQSTRLGDGVLGLWMER